MALVAGGLFLFTYRATQFDGEGFALVLAASFLGGIRWTLTQLLLQKEDLGACVARGSGASRGPVAAAAGRGREPGRPPSHP